MQHEQRLAALAVTRVLAGATLPAALAAVDDGAPTRGHALVQELAYGTLRHWGRLAAVTEALAAKPLPDATLAALVAVALYQLDYTQAPAFAVVDRAVEAAALVARPQAKALVNALLRRYLRERDALNRAAVAASPVARWSYPRWWIGRVEADHPHHWQRILEVGNERPPLTLRVNRRATTRDALAASMAAADVATMPVGAAGLIVTTPRPVTELPGYAEGAFSVQDAGAQLAAPLLDVRDGMRVLDACAAPGGKTTHIAELADVDLLAARQRRRPDRARAREPRAAAPRPSVDPRGRRRCRRAGRLVGRPPVRPHPGRTSPARRPASCGAIRTSSGCAARATSRRSSPSSSASSRRSGRCSRRAVACCTRPARCSRPKTSCRSRTFLRPTPAALRETISFPADCPHDGGQLLPAGNGEVHNQDGFFYALLRKA